MKCSFPSFLVSGSVRVDRCKGTIPESKEKV
uniref:Uncharacterized protein n=1 Tax=Siphoviridae sp. ctBLh2 TaxID=2827803 RepID=A0A8S5S448_9CAUD|nr:MAG TPA: hypothetical protein [Siphoviridae sp. ctBLh2]